MCVLARIPIGLYSIHYTSCCIQHSTVDVNDRISGDYLRLFALIKTFARRKCEF